MNEREQDRHDDGGHVGNESDRATAGLRKGIRAFFDVDDITIAFWGSAWSGLEVVTVDERMVSRKRSLRFLTRHSFEYGGVRYEILFRVRSILRGEMDIELYREGELVDSDCVQQNRLGLDPESGRFSTMRLVRQLAPYFLVGMVTGGLAAFLVDYLTGA